MHFRANGYCQLTVAQKVFARNLSKMTDLSRFSCQKLSSCDFFGGVGESVCPRKTVNISILVQLIVVR